LSPPRNQAGLYRRQRVGRHDTVAGVLRT